MGKVLLHFSRARHLDMEILDLVLYCQVDLWEGELPSHMNVLAELLFHVYIVRTKRNETKQNEKSPLYLGLHVSAHLSWRA